MSLLGNLEERQGHCETHGEFTSIRFADRWMGCPKCADERIEAEHKIKDAEFEEERKRSIKIARLQAIGLPRMFHKATLENYRANTTEQQKVLSACQRYAKEFGADTGRGMIFIGELGNGKTHLGCAVLRELSLAGYRAIYTTEKAVGLRMKASYRSRNESELDILNAYTTPDVLFVDEVGLSTGSDHDAGLLNTILTERYAESRATIIATNLTAEGLKSWIGERATDRLRQTSSVYLFNWKSFRGQA